MRLGSKSSFILNPNDCDHAAGSGWCPARVHRLDTIFGRPQVTPRRAIRPTVALRVVICFYVAIMIHGGRAQGQ